MHAEQLAHHAIQTWLPAAIRAAQSVGIYKLQYVMGQFLSFFTPHRGNSPRDTRKTDGWLGPIVKFGPIKFLLQPVQRIKIAPWLTLLCCTQLRCMVSGILTHFCSPYFIFPASFFPLKSFISFPFPIFFSCSLIPQFPSIPVFFPWWIWACCSCCSWLGAMLTVKEISSCKYSFTPVAVQCGVVRAASLQRTCTLF